MYDELVKRLRASVDGRYEKCDGCPYEEDYPCCVDCLDKMHKQAADAIETMCEMVATAHCELANVIQSYEEEKPRWIPVTERLPIGGDDSGAMCENVCLLIDDGTVSCGWMNGITKKVYYLNARDDVVIKAPITRVTHWMPLPPAPKEE